MLCFCSCVKCIVEFIREKEIKFVCNFDPSFIFFYILYTRHIVNLQDNVILYIAVCFTKRQMRIESVVTTKWNFTGSHFITSLYKCLLVKIFPQSLRLELFSLFQEQSGHNLAKSFETVSVYFRSVEHSKCIVEGNFIFSLHCLYIVYIWRSLLLFIGKLLVFFHFLFSFLFPNFLYSTKLSGVSCLHTSRFYICVILELLKSITRWGCDKILKLNCFITRTNGRKWAASNEHCT